MKKNILITILFLIILIYQPIFSFSKEAYIIGVNMAVTGPGSETYAPIKDALDIYFKEINTKGGINGHPVEIIIEDNANQPSKAVAQVKKLITQDKVVLIIYPRKSVEYVCPSSRGKSEI